MRSWLQLSASVPRADRPDEFADDVSFPESLVEAFLDEFTDRGDVVLDPFAGFGTTLAVAERMGRRPIGVELLPERVEFIRSRVSDETVVRCADARQLTLLNLGQVDFVMTSPPYMTRENHPQNPLTGYQTLDGDYEVYLGELSVVFATIASLLAPNGRVVVNVANIRVGGPEVTTLAWDVVHALSPVLRFEREVVICWDIDHGWITNDYCMVFRRDSSD